jgi:hypothetical protein
MPSRVEEAIRKYLEGRIDLETAAQQLFVLWHEEGWGPYFEYGHLPDAQRERARRLEARFSELARGK